ncbi:polysaccharide pyruvyl transferase family protein [Nocardioides sp. T2.26MG-1]|uniref:polysaccharide pyruvyl transferase family protein n=1 Tax=Nocardioides sp. T2.26MG-1 TaxID=3041166 RepID=UPI00253FD51E|nr:polysaccharide pyruvyl transferase family protein [Nocardioides sp. T2.26MG-1]
MTHYAGTDTKALYARVGRNTGNMAFTTAIADQLDAEISFRGWSTSPELLAEADLVVMPCANQFGSHTDLGQLGDLLLEADVPVLAIGLGAQSSAATDDAEPTPGTLHWARAVARLRYSDTPNILVRGEYTRSQLAKHGITSTEVIGCPSHFLSGRRNLGESIESRVTGTEPERIATLAARSTASNLKVVDQIMVSLAAGSTQGLPWVLQEELELIDLARGKDVDPADLARLTRHFAPGLDPELFEQWARSNAVVFFEIEAWIEHMQRFEVCVGPRFHGAMMAMQAGTPAVVVTHDSRTKELCDTTGLPSVPAQDLEDQGPRAMWATLRSFDGRAFDANRAQLAKTYVTLLKGHGLAARGTLAALAR